MDHVKRIWYLSPMRAAKVQASPYKRQAAQMPSCEHKFSPCFHKTLNKILNKSYLNTCKTLCLSDTDKKYYHYYDLFFSILNIIFDAL